MERPRSCPRGFSSCGPLGFITEQLCAEFPIEGNVVPGDFPMKTQVVEEFLGNIPPGLVKAFSVVFLFNGLLIERLTTFEADFPESSS
mmetsp:Transcript_29093/g.43163  ORF Transcript_29093/g.43163 Transcript_29093/m.43163 type:complete len:88 (-) Transcript_29093:569-832(-)